MRSKDVIDGSDLTGSPHPDASVDGGNSASAVTGTKTSSVDKFYQKLCKFYESSGLSLLFNFRETSLDLYMFYKEVTERGGYNLVTKAAKWGEVSSTLNSKTIVPMSTTQLQKIYATFLFQFEQIYHYRSPAKVADTSGHPSGTGDSLCCPAGKRKRCDNSDMSKVHSDTKDGTTIKRQYNDNSNQLSTGPISAAEQKLVVQTSPKDEPKKGPKDELKKDRNAPVGSRTGYQIFLRKECNRLKKIHGETSATQNIKNMAMDAWRHLSQSDKQPYIEESKKDKERFIREMAAYNEGKNTISVKTKNVPHSTKPIVSSNSVPLETDGDYHVTLQTTPENFIGADESAVALASRLLKNVQPNDPIFEINWDQYCGSLDLPC